ncbi:MAG TPA: NAD-glutamate dehydrogenase [Gammaproteobacteria bacterium]|jgi:glutamate dehydrogenase|nr:NAD-glutamate dehydrogenase [Gammaproteobacteria bacterium]
MPQRKSNSKNKHLDSVIALAKKHSQDPALAAFIQQYYDDIAEEDLLQHSVEDLCGAALGHWTFGAKRAAHESRVRVFNPDAKKNGWKSPHTIIEMVNDDMPFLVDSTIMALTRNGIGVHLTIHPILRLKRDTRGVVTKLDESDDALAESWIHIEVDHQSDAANLKQLEAELQSAMRDVHATVSDWQVMRDKVSDVCKAVDAYRGILSDEEVDEGQLFLKWMLENHFTFLGFREYQLVEENGEDVLKVVPKSGIGILRNAKDDAVSSHLVLPKDVRKRAHAHEFMIITKANSMATVHRPGYLDYVGIKRFDAKGNVNGEWRFLGLFTSTAYSRSPRDIPVTRKKVAEVLRRSELPAKSHDLKALLHILETFPRDELMQSTTDELFETAMDVVHLQERQRVKLFIRRDGFGRFFSCLVYLPRDRYNSQVRSRIENLLYRALNGKSVEHNVTLSESALARLHIIVRTAPWKLPKYDRAALEQEIALAVRSWQDELREALVEHCGEERGLSLFGRYANHFPAAYQEDIKARTAAFDIEQIDTLTGETSLRMSLYRPTSAPSGYLRFKTFHREQPIPISDALPMLENMGVRVISERPYELELRDDSIIWVQDFELVHQGELDVEALKDLFQEQFVRVWRGEAENDGFNRLVLSAGLNWRQTTLLRAYCKYLLQTSLNFSQAYMERAIYANPQIAKLIVKLFEARLDPSAARDRDVLTQRYITEIDKALESVSSLDEDRILRGFINVVRATLRTNYFQTTEHNEPKTYLSFKFDPSQLPDLPLPKPVYEIWVYSPRVEGVHLRGGKVARGGIRWSDRREDFRTEVLGLMKAQQVKNTVIVPVGSKGGFYVKRPPRSGNREDLLKEGIACYQTFMRGLLDITDNIVDGKIAPPPKVMRHDGDDPYLVVAADKGTATFSDIANGVSREYRFWLDDAFASGGSAGYDHKKMGITAKGGWESVKRHFREMGIDTQSTDFTVVGVGDMSGDVFGNGMLLSRHIRLIAAFDHRHIFLDPTPDAEHSFRERERLFNLPRSSWDDYDRELISAGGGVFPRSAKLIKISPEMRAVLGIEAHQLTPQDLMRAILKAPVDLLWNGGIGTYVKSSRESNNEVGDRNNDGIRVNGRDLRCKVVGEGGNLGCTQLGRVEYALHDGRLNTDFIDNSAGVDCSDHEVNIKILLNVVASEKRFTETQRNKLLAEMTDEVGELVLRDNYMQAQALSIAESQAPARINEHGYLMRALEQTGLLNRGIEFLPSNEELKDRKAAGRGLTRPELAVLLAYSKISIYNALLAGDVAEDPYLANELESYFPTALRKRYQELMPKHRLRREIICTAITNSIVNRMGSTFTQRMQEEAGVGVSSVARAYTIARESYDTISIWAAIEALDNKVPANVQLSMATQTSGLLKHATRWLLDHMHGRLDIAATVPVYRPGIETLREHVEGILSETQVETYHRTVEQYMDVGVPESLARRIACQPLLFTAFDLVDVAAERKLPIEVVGRVYFHIGRELELEWLRKQIEGLSVEGHWQAVARGTLRDDLYSQQRALTSQALAKAKDARSAMGQLDTWFSERSSRIQHAQRVLNDMKTAGISDFPSLSVAMQEIRKLARVVN